MLEKKKPTELKKGGYVMINGEPCRVLSISTSRPGKHGHAKSRIVGVGIFDGVKREFIATHEVDCPIIEKKKGQVLALMGTQVQIMDSLSFETFELPLPEGISLQDGQEITYIDFDGRKKITLAKGQEDSE